MSNNDVDRAKAPACEELAQPVMTNESRHVYAVVRDGRVAEVYADDKKISIEVIDMDDIYRSPAATLEKLNEVRKHFDELGKPLTDDVSDLVYIIVEYGSVKDYYADCRRNNVEIIDTDDLKNEEEYEECMALLNQVRSTMQKIF